MAMLDIAPESQPVTLKKLNVGTKVVMGEDYYQDTEKKKTVRKKKKDDESGETVVEVVPTNPDNMLANTQRSYKDTYQETDMMLKGSIYQLDQASSEISEDLAEIRRSRTLKNKYSYIADLSSARASMISTKISAIKELNNSIKAAHDFEIKRAKETKASEMQRDDVKSIQDMYSAFVSMPVQQGMNGPFTNPLGPSTLDFTLQNGMNANPAVQYAIAMMNQDPDAGFNNYLNNMSPEQMTMLIEDNPNINQVIAYNPNTGAAEFRYFDSAQQTYIEGIPTRSAEMFMGAMQFNFDTMTARSEDLNETFKIIMDENIGNGPDMSNY